VSATSALNLAELLRETLTSRVYDVARETPLDPAPRLSLRVSNNVFLKREDQQPVFSFKLRGAYNKISRLTPAERERGVIAASAGNHAQGVALAARKLGLRAVIVMPRTTPEIKVEAVRAMGAEAVLWGDNYSDAQEHCDELAARTGLTFVPAFHRAGRDFRTHRRRRADFRHRRLREGRDAADQNHRRPAQGKRRHVSIGCGGPSGDAESRRHLCGRRRRAHRGTVHVSADSKHRRCNPPRRQRRSLRRHE
jgi:hypothetical protein